MQVPRKKSCALCGGCGGARVGVSGGGELKCIGVGGCRGVQSNETKGDVSAQNNSGGARLHVGSVDKGRKQGQEVLHYLVSFTYR